MTDVRTKNGKIIADEICKCGHSIRDHGVVKLVNGNDIDVEMTGGGQCLKCKCDHYRWERYKYQKGEK